MLPSDARGCVQGETVVHPTHVDLPAARYHFSFAIRTCSVALISVVCHHICQRAASIEL